MKYLLFALLLVCTGASAQTPFPTSSLHLEWELIQNQYQGKLQTLSKLRLLNTGKKNLPPAGWALYFNFVRLIQPEAAQASHFDVQHLGGDWFRLKPRAGFPGLPAGRQYEIVLVSELWLLNCTDAPNGFYLVFDAEPEEGYPVGPLSVLPPANPALLLRSPEDRTPPATPAGTFRQNEATADIPAAALRPVFPTPVFLETRPGSFNLDANTAIHADPAFEREARLLAASWPAWFGQSGSIKLQAGGQPRGILLRHSESAGHPEGYTLEISAENGIAIGASGAAGIFYGIQTLKMLLPPELWQRPQASVQVPCLLVRDEPRFGYRGLHVDVARNFQPAAEIRKLLDVMALYKLNKLHFHFSEDEGWRIEIPGLPELTELGARRGHATGETRWLHPAFGSGPGPGQAPGSGHYTRQEFIDLLKYAAERHIEVIPEIELPGHARAAIKAMDARHARLLREGRPEEARQYLLRDPEDQSQYRSVQEHTDNVICVGLPSAIAFVEKVTDELLAMYREAGAPLRTVHLGGDEVPAGVWEKSPACRRLMEAEGLRETADLWYWFYRKMYDLLARRGLALSGWEEAGLRKTRLDGAPHYLPNPDFADKGFRMYVWNNVLGWGAEDLAYRMANAGYQVVLGPVSNLYFDMAYQKDFDEPGYYWGAYTDVDKAFGFVPFDYFKTSTEDRFGNPIDPAIFIGKSRLTDYGKSNILGLEGLLWGETLGSPEALEYMAFPKLLGLAERAWSPAPDYETTADSALFRSQYARAWSHFANQLGKRELPRLDFYAGGLQYRIPTPGAVVRDGMWHVNIQLPGLTLRYTTDGSAPTPESAVYSGPVAARGIFKIRAFDRRGRGGRVATLRP